MNLFSARMPKAPCALVLCMALLTLYAAPASAQWAWKDDNGRTTFSDQPPPMSVPLSHIVRSPDPNARPPAPSAPPSPAGDSAGGDAAKPKTFAEKQAEQRKKEKDAADAEAKANKEAAAAKEKKEQCQALRNNLAALQSDNPIAKPNADGSLSQLDQPGRAREIARINDIISKNCK